MSSEYCTRDDIANHFAVSPHTVGGWVRKGLFPKGSVIKVGQTYRFKLKEIEQYFMEQARTTDPQAPEEGAPKQLELPLEMPSDEPETLAAPSFDFDSDDDI